MEDIPVMRICDFRPLGNGHAVKHVRNAIHDPEENIGAAARERGTSYPIGSKCRHDVTPRLPDASYGIRKMHNGLGRVHDLSIPGQNRVMHKAASDIEAYKEILT